MLPPRPGAGSGAARRGECGRAGGRARARAAGQHGVRGAALPCPAPPRPGLASAPGSPLPRAAAARGAEPPRKGAGKARGSPAALGWEELRAAAAGGLGAGLSPAPRASSFPRRCGFGETGTSPAVPGRSVAPRAAPARSRTSRERAGSGSRRGLLVPRSWKGGRASARLGKLLGIFVAVMRSLTVSEAAA